MSLRSHVSLISERLSDAEEVKQLLFPLIVSCSCASAIARVFDERERVFVSSFVT